VGEGGGGWGRVGVRVAVGKSLFTHTISLAAVSHATAPPFPVHEGPQSTRQRKAEVDDKLASLAAQQAACTASEVALSERERAVIDSEARLRARELETVRGFDELTAAREQLRVAEEVRGLAHPSPCWWAGQRSDGLAGCLCPAPSLPPPRRSRQGPLSCGPRARALQLHGPKLTKPWPVCAVERLQQPRCVVAGQRGWWLWVSVCVCGHQREPPRTQSPVDCTFDGGSLR
jgi:hypothetical protein